jgi:hypothetical protein
MALRMKLLSVRVFLFKKVFFQEKKNNKKGLFPKNLGELYRASSAALASFSRSVSRVVGNGEAIAAMSGTNVEEQLVRSKFSSVSRLESFCFFSFWFNDVKSVLSKQYSLLRPGLRSRFLWPICLFREA